MFLQQQHLNITQFDSEIPPWPRSSREFHAARYRRSQLGILKSTLLLLSKLLLEASGKKDEVVKLEDILVNLPEPVGSEYRMALRRVLRTRNPSKIRKGGYEDLAFTVWLCCLYLFSETHDNNPEKRAPRLHVWLDLIHTSYCPPPGWEAPKCVGVNCQERWVAENTEEETTELRAIAESYLSVVKEAARKQPDSIFSDSRWTVDFLRWGYNIVQAEGFRCPKLGSSILDGEGNGDGDEFMLFLDVDATAFTEPVGG